MLSMQRDWPDAVILVVGAILMTFGAELSEWLSRRNNRHLKGEEEMKPRFEGVLVLLLLVGCGSGDRPADPSQPKLTPGATPTQSTSTPAPAAQNEHALGANPAVETTDPVAKAIAIYEKNKYTQNQERAARMALRQCGIDLDSEAAKDFYKAVGLEQSKGKVPGQNTSATNLSNPEGGFNVPGSK
ncbi:MAG: hypothetical protein M5U26_13250 [Planctomycetota bacterium]|nr:hypothetical protein [Planctomycetota bacterium]